MAKDSPQPAQGIRERHLNIVYFVDSAKSHSIRLHLGLARWILAATIVVMMWAVMSIFWIFELGTNLEQTRGHLSLVLHRLFDYQVKYEKIFEEAYPDSAVPMVSGKTSTTAAAKVAGEAAQQGGKASVVVTEASPSTELVKTDSLPTELASKEKDGETAQGASQASAGPDTAAAASVTKVIQIANPSLTASDGQMLLMFDMTNMDPKRKADGYVWATANLVMADGTIKHIAAPSHTKINKDGNVDAYNSTYKFSIQRFKRKDFTFSVPNDETWKITDLSIGMVDASGKNRKMQPINTTLKFQKPAANGSDDAVSDSPDQ
jgi:hypothetical protein